jgi:outer membrane murein-binding lipoprotein Lpp
MWSSVVVGLPPPGLREVPGARKKDRAKKKRRGKARRRNYRRRSRRAVERLRLRSLSLRIRHLKAYLPKLEQKVRQVRSASEKAKKKRTTLQERLKKKASAYQQASGKRSRSISGVFRKLRFHSLSVDPITTTSARSGRTRTTRGRKVDGDRFLIRAELRAPKEIIDEQSEVIFGWQLFGLDAFGESVMLDDRKLFGGKPVKLPDVSTDITSRVFGLGLLPGNYLLVLQLFSPKAKSALAARYTSFRVDSIAPTVTAPPIGKTHRVSNSLRVDRIHVRSPGQRRIAPERLQVRFSYHVDRTIHRKDMVAVVGATAERLDRRRAGGKPQRATLFRHLDKPRPGRNVFGGNRATLIKGLGKLMGPGKVKVTVFVAAEDGRRLLYSARSKVIVIPEPGGR